MRVAVTGTPGTGKTTATTILEARLETESEPNLEVVHLNDVLEREGCIRKSTPNASKVADLEALSVWLEGREDVVIESHLAHHFDADRVAVLRCRPDDLGATPRPWRERGKATENAESEALDVILSEAVEEHGLDSVYEIDTTDRDPEAVADDLESVLAGEREPSAGDVDFVGYLA
ncbi:adenylate kinase [Natrialba swarupiae]|nr:adenylate kinase [Natrialba swarupiae]